MNHQPTTGYVKVGDFFVCNCRVRLAKHISSGMYEILRRDNGQSITLSCQAVGGIIKVKCNKCGRGFNYISVRDTMGFVDRIAVEKRMVV